MQWYVLKELLSNVYKKWCNKHYKQWLTAGDHEINHWTRLDVNLDLKYYIVISTLGGQHSEVSLRLGHVFISTHDWNCMSTKVTVRGQFKIENGEKRTNKGDKRWQWCWWHRYVGDLKLGTISRCWWLNFDVGDIFWMLVPDAYVKR